MGVGTVTDVTLDRLGNVLGRALDGLTRSQLTAQPAGPTGNTVAWCAFHLARVQDNNYALFAGIKTLFQTGWNERFGLPADFGSGGGMTIEQVRAFDPADAPTLLAYWQAVRAVTKAYLLRLDDAAIAAPRPASPTMRVEEDIATAIARVTSDCGQHVGQVAYLRGLLDKHGWYGA
jgi:hypothetical protein